MKPRIKSAIKNIRKQKQPIRTTRKKKREAKKKSEDSVSSLWDNFKCSNITGVPEGEEKEQEIANIFEKIMKKTFCNLVKEIDMQVQEIQSPKQDGCKEANSSIHHN